MRIGIAGLGKMGAAMAARLAEGGADIAVWNRTRDKAEASGLPVADTPAALAQRSDIIITILFDAPALQAVFHGPDGLLSAASGKLFIEMSTVRPETQEALAAAVRGVGGTYVECPVGGTTGPARAGQLLGFAGGDADDIARARPVLDLLCRRVEHVGPIGAGAAVKLAVNLPLLVFWQAFGESMALVHHLGLDPARLVALFSETAGGANVLKVKAGAIAAGLAGGDGGTPSFDIDSMRKDLSTMLAEAEARGFSLPVAAQAYAISQAVSEGGWGKRDCAWLPAHWAAKAESVPT
jgi:3-hydroxyisobutyrate dehydrogenase